MVQCDTAFVMVTDAASVQRNVL